MALPDLWDHEPARFVPEPPRAVPNGERKRNARVAVYHRNGLFVDAMQTVFEFESVDVRAADSIETLFEFAGSSDACVIDMRIEGARDALRALAGRYEQLRLVGITESTGERHAHPTAASGAHAYVETAEGLDRLLAVIQDNGRMSDLPRRSAGSRNGSRVTRDPRRLTTRESEILEGLLDGENTKMLAARLGVSQATARTHVQSVLTKLGVHTRLEAVALFQSRDGLSLLGRDVVDGATA
jgi:two-component system nitrate/nitrite response regulator NarL